jgi:DeoR/GlpR family transcriptional regulator of sugar metabolism
MPALIPEERRRQIVQSLRRTPVLSYAELAAALNVSPMTIRRDVAELEQRGRVITTTGGVMTGTHLPVEPSRTQKDTADRAQKFAISRKAASLVENEMTIYLDAGTTLQPMRQHLEPLERVAVVTDDLTIAASFIDHPTIDVIVVGGKLDKRNDSLTGRLSALTLRELSIDIAFLSTSSWDLPHGITTPSDAKVEPKRAASAAASLVVLCAASSKYGSFARYRVLELAQIDRIITDDGLSESAAEAVKATVGTEVDRVVSDVASVAG